MKIRIARPEDAAELLKIYAPYVEKTAITFEYDIPTLEDFQGRIRHTLERYPYLVAERDDAIVGYAYAGAFNVRKAYDHAAEMTIYLAPDAQKMGLGRKLYTALEGVLRLQNVLNADACIGYPEVEDEYLTKNSARFHEHLGYHLVGEFKGCGYKFGRWYNMIWMEKFLAPHTQNPAPFRPFPEIRDLLREKYGIE